MSCLLRPLLTTLALLVLGVRPTPAESVPSNVIDHSLGGSASSLSIRLVSVPYYIGDRIVLEATVRNTSTAPFLLPDPRALFVNVGAAPDPAYSLGPGIEFVQHSCPSLGQIDDVSQGPLECLDHLRKRSARLGPGETRTATYVSQLPYRLLHDPRVEGKSPATIGVRVSSHDILPDRWFRFQLHRFQDPIRGQLREHPWNRKRYFFFTAPSGPREYILFQEGGWHSILHRVPERIDATHLHQAMDFERIAVVTKPDPVVTFDAQGRVLVDGVPAPPRKIYQFEERSNSRWALSEDAPASSPASIRQRGGASAGADHTQPVDAR